MTFAEDLTAAERLNLENALNFIVAAADALTGGANSADFKCSICGGEAHVIRSENNGHKHASCNSCGFRVME